VNERKMNVKYIALPILAAILFGTTTAYAENFTVEMTQNGFSTNNLSINEGDSITFVNTHYVTDVNLEPHAISDPFAIPYTEHSYWIIDDSTPERVYNFDSCESYVFYDRFFDVEPIIVQCNNQTVQDTTSEPTYQTTKDGITTVDVFTIPFDVTITENGSVTVHNTDSVDHVVSHTGTTGTAKSGTFYEVIPAQQQTTIEFPITGNTIYESGVYAFEDTVTGKSGSITIIPWNGSKQAIQDDTVTGIAQGVVEQVGIQESIVVVLTPENNQSETAETSQANDLSLAPTVIADYTVLSLQKELVQSEKRLTGAIESVALLKIELDSSMQVIAKQKQDITVLSVELEKGLSVEEETKLNNTVSELKTQVASLSKDNESLIVERDQWKQLSDNWYAVAQEQLRVMIDVLGL
jgi:FtsZ-binding cell division protein ZapB